jgi:hypothetical protein
MLRIKLMGFIRDILQLLNSCLLTPAFIPWAPWPGSEDSPASSDEIAIPSKEIAQRRR